MDFECRISRIEGTQKNIQMEIDSLKKEYEDCVDFTEKFLDLCKKKKITRVAIGKKDEELKDCKPWPFGYQGSVFADGRCGSWPAIWSVVEELGISGGCGNCGEHSINGNALLIDGIYEYKEDKWNKIG